MNKKILILILVILVVLIMGIVVGVTVLKDDGNTTQENENQINNEEIVSDDVKEENTQNETNEKKNLIVYFSQTGNTQEVANTIQSLVGGDIIKLETVEPYPDDYDTLSTIAQQEKDDNARPQLSTNIENIDEYDTIFLGYPIWFSDMPMAIYTFLDEYDLSGKTIAPFCTSGGSGLSSTPVVIQTKEPNATVTGGLSISSSDASNSQSEVQEWLDRIGL